MKKVLKTVMASLLATTMLVGCTGGAESSDAKKESVELNSMSLEDIVSKAKEEGSIQSVGMPDTWANWVETWQDIEKKYGIKHKDTDMSSAEELALFEQEKANGTKDIGDVGQAFGPIAVEKGVSLPYKTSYWDDIPDWAKDKDGHWIVGYYGTMAIMTNTDKVKNPPKSFEDLRKGDYKVTVGDVNAANQAQNAVLSVARAYGGDEGNIQPGIDFFAELAEQGRLDLGDTTIERIESGEIEVGLFWDFNALNYAAQIAKDTGKNHFFIVIPEKGAVQSGYATIINKYGPHPHAAALAREYILSDEGQINLAKGFARPIRKSLELPEDVKNKLLPDEQYANAEPIKDAEAWEKTTKELGGLWQSYVITKVK